MAKEEGIAAAIVTCAAVLAFITIFLLIAREGTEKDKHDRERLALCEAADGIYLNEAGHCIKKEAVLF